MAAIHHTAMVLVVVPIVFVPALGRTFSHNAWLAALVMPFALSFQKEIRIFTRL